MAPARVNCPTGSRKWKNRLRAVFHQKEDFNVFRKGTGKRFVRRGLQFGYSFGSDFGRLFLWIGFRMGLFSRIGFRMVSVFRSDWIRMGLFSRIGFGLFSWIGFGSVFVGLDPFSCCSVFSNRRWQNVTTRHIVANQRIILW